MGGEAALTDGPAAQASGSKLPRHRLFVLFVFVKTGRLASRFLGGWYQPPARLFNASAAAAIPAWRLREPAVKQRQARHQSGRSQRRTSRSTARC